MKVQRIEQMYWQVSSNGRWWTVCRTHQGWNIRNEAGKRIAPSGRLGQRLIAAVTEPEEAA